MRDEFKVHILNEQGIEQAQAVGEIFSATLDQIERILPAGRERAIVVTKLQEAAFFAKRGVVSKPENQG